MTDIVQGYKKQQINYPNLCDSAGALFRVGNHKSRKCLKFVEKSPCKWEKASESFETGVQQPVLIDWGPVALSEIEFRI